MIFHWVARQDAFSEDDFLLMLLRNTYICTQKWLEKHATRLCFHCSSMLTWISKFLFLSSREQLRVLWNYWTDCIPIVLYLAAFIHFLTKNSIFWFTVCLKYMESKESACFTWHSELCQSRFVPYFLKKLSELRWSSIDFVNESKCGKHLNCVYKFFVQSNKHSIFSRIFFSRVVVVFSRCKLAFTSTWL